jgi:hypothetical protein
MLKKWQGYLATLESNRGKAQNNSQWHVTSPPFRLKNASRFLQKRWLYGTTDLFVEKTPGGQIGLPD